MAVQMWHYKTWTLVPTGTHVPTVAVEEEVLRRGVVRESLAQLVNHPSRCRIRLHVEVYNTSAAMLDDKEHVKHPQRGRRHG